MLSTMIVAGAAAARADRRAATAALAVYVASKAWYVALLPDEAGTSLFGEFPVVAVCIGLAWLIGNTVRRRQVAERRVAELAEQARRARERERALLARELHDVVAHELTIIAMQATLLRISTDPDEVGAARTVIEETSRRALDELKRLLQVLRTDEGQETVAAQQAPVDAIVDALADQLRALGHDVGVTCRVGAMPRSVELAADRVLREAVTNIIKHAPDAADVDIEVVDETEALSIVVANDAAGSRLRSVLSSTRLGLPGLRERLSLLGGSFSAGAEGDRWVVRACIPYRPTAGGLPAADDGQGPV